MHACAPTRRLLSISNALLLYGLILVPISSTAFVTPCESPNLRDRPGVSRLRSILIVSIRNSISCDRRISPFP